MSEQAADAAGDDSVLPGDAAPVWGDAAAAAAAAAVVAEAAGVERESPDAGVDVRPAGGCWYAVLGGGGGADDGGGIDADLSAVDSRR